MTDSCLVQCTAEKIVFGGDAMAHTDGKVLFLSGVLPGEEVIARIVSEHPNYLKGRVERFASPSPDRIVPACPYANRCPGCVYAHVSPEAEVRYKNTQLREMVEHALPEDREIDFGEPFSGAPEFYRNKIVLHARRVGREVSLGYLGYDNTTVCDIEQCRLAMKPINEELARLRANPSFMASLHDGISVTLQWESEKQRVAVWRNNPSAHASYLREQYSFGPFSVPQGSFQQVNDEGCEELLAEFGRELESAPTACVCDLYCGAGLFGAFAAAKGIREVVGVENNENAAQCARYNWSRYPETHALVLTGDAAKLTQQAVDAAGPGALYVVDPPRAGLAAKSLAMLTESGARKLVMISCHPATWLRDVGRFRAKNWRLRRVRMVNMFPRTGHFEVFSVLEAQ